VTRLLSLAPFAALAGGLVLAALPTPALATDSARPFAAQYDRESRARALRCLTEAIYYEARSETEDGQRAVAQVVLNRVRHPSYPASVCGVVYQGSHRRTGCQFSFTCDGSMARGVSEGAAWERAQRVAQAALGGYVHRPAGLALNYHTTAIRPYWAPSLVRHAVIGAHIFYRHPASGSVAAFDQAPARAEPSPGTSVNFVARAPRTTAPQRRASGFQPARVEAAIMERVRVERYQVERPAFQHPSGRISRQRSTPVAAPRSQPQTRAVANRRGPRTTIEGGVRVARGS
jgi:hypothetical protein